jgi:hypothetical protein
MKIDIYRLTYEIKEVSQDEIIRANGKKLEIGESIFGLHCPFEQEILLDKKLKPDGLLRTLAHELVHRKQGIEGRLFAGAGADGTDIENEANAEAAVIMRRFGKANPIIFE